MENRIKCAPNQNELSSKSGVAYILCPLCKEEPKPIIHLFCKCNVSRAIWFSNCWGLHSNAFSTNNYEELIQMIIDPPIIKSDGISDKTLKEQSSTQLALTLDCIWQLRNQAIHSDKPINIHLIIKSLEVRIMEQIHASTFEASEAPEEACKWGTTNKSITSPLTWARKEAHTCCPNPLLCPLIWYLISMLSI